MDTGFRYDRHAISFQSSGIDSSSEMIMMGNCYQMNGTTTTTRNTRFVGNPVVANNRSGFTQSGSCCGSVVGDSVLGLKHDAGLAVEWSVEEQKKLEEGLSK